MARYRVLEKTIDNKNNRELKVGQIVEIEWLEKVGKNLELIEDLAPPAPPTLSRKPKAPSDVGNML